MSIYTLLTRAAFPFLKRKLVRRFGPEYIQQRLYPASHMAGSYDFLVHAASVGEQMVIRPVVQALIEQGKSVLLTAATDTGLERAVSHFGSMELVTTGYLPFDMKQPVNRFFEAVSFQTLVLVETEIWPLLIEQAKDGGARIVLVNGRLSDGAYRNYCRAGKLMASAFRAIDACLVRYEIDGDRFRRLGVKPDGIRITGNLKLVPVEAPEPIQIVADAPIVVFGSTREGEEAIILDGVEDMLVDNRICGVFAPRHPERATEVAAILEKAGLTVVTSGGRQVFDLEAGEIVLINETGRLRSFYAASDLCFVGGSLVDTGGQNFVEPVALKKPVVTGPHLDNFQDIYPLFADGMWQVQDGAGLRSLLDRFVTDKVPFEEKAERASASLSEQNRALERTMEVLI